MLRSRVIACGALVVLVAGATAVVGPWAGAASVEGFETVYGTDVVYAGYGGMRGGDGTGQLTVADVSGTVTEALLYWHGPTDSTDTTVNADITFDGTDITGDSLGLASPNCWDFENSQGYRADVTSLVSGNGVYTLANMIKSEADINGASLLVFFDDGNDANNRDVVLFDGNDSNESGPSDDEGWDVTLDGINYTSGSASLDLHVSDGQIYDDDALTVNGTEIAPAPLVFSGDTTPAGPTAADTDGALWDISSYDVTSLLSPGDNTLHFTTGWNDDCLSLIVAAVNLPAGSAPGQPTTTTTTTTTTEPTTTTVAPAPVVAAQPAFTG